MTAFDYPAYFARIYEDTHASEVARRDPDDVVRYLRSVHPATAVGLDELVPGMGIYRDADVWIVETKRSDGWLHLRRESDDHYEWVEAAGETWHLAEPF